MMDFLTVSWLVGLTIYALFTAYRVISLELELIRMIRIEHSRKEKD